MRRKLEKWLKVDLRKDFKIIVKLKKTLIYPHEGFLKPQKNPTLTHALYTFQADLNKILVSKLCVKRIKMCFNVSKVLKDITKNYVLKLKIQFILQKF